MDRGGNIPEARAVPHGAAEHLYVQVSAARVSVQRIPGRARARVSAAAPLLKRGVLLALLIAGLLALVHGLGARTEPRSADDEHPRPLPAFNYPPPSYGDHGVAAPPAAVTIDADSPPRYRTQSGAGAANRGF